MRPLLLPPHDLGRDSSAITVTHVEPVPTNAAVEECGVPRSLVGKLLVASPILEDSNFARTVVLICTHDAGGAFGLVLNRPLGASVDQYLPAWSGPLAAPAVVFNGGPVDASSAFGLARGDVRDPALWLSPPLDGDGGPVGMVDLDRVEDLRSAGVEEFRIFSGYAGWDGGQLQGELLGESWFVVDALPRDAFSEDPSGLWHEVLRRQQGHLAMFGFFPDDPRVN
jgi:putative transcriptional regulator